MDRLSRLSLLTLFFIAGCKTVPAAEDEKAPVAAGEPAKAAAAEAAIPLPLKDRPAPAKYAATEGEPHLRDLQQISFGGENAEAYWSFNGKELIMQVRYEGMGCDRIVRMDVAQGLPSVTPVSSGKGTTTCSYFLPGDQEVVYASTHLGGDACPPKPDMSKGYVWALYDTFDIFRGKKDGSGALTRLTNNPGYDAEATVCGKDGSIIFTSVRDGDIELYRMDADGKNVKRLTHTPGYDGGAFFNSDCSKIVWRASRPKPGPELDDFNKLLKEGLVRPSKLELFVANPDGSDATQVTYLNAASFGPFFTPDSKAIIFSSNYGDPKGREFDLFLINVDGTNLQRVTKAPGFDGFPMFSPDGKTLIFASNRATAPGKQDTNLFLARWVGDASSPVGDKGAAERILADVAWLADPAREGRGVGLAGLAASGEYLEKRFTELGVAPAGNKKFRYEFNVPSKIEVGAKTQLSIDGKPAAAGDISPLGFSGLGSAEGALLFAGYGVVAADIGVDDYKGLDPKGKIVVVRRFVPDGEKFATTDAKRRYGDIRYKAWVAKERGAKAVLVVDAPLSMSSTTAQASAEAPLPKTTPEGPGDAGIPVLAVKRAALAAVLADSKAAKAKVVVELKTEQVPAFNVVGKIAAKKAIGAPIVIGAHYDHLGMGGRDSLAPDKQEAHVGADDNASGTAALLEIAKVIAAQKDTLKRDVYFMAFSGEESGILGSNALVKKPPKGLKANEIYAMLNLDMVGRLRDNRLTVIGGETATEWPEIVDPICATARVSCTTTGGGFGPSDHTPFYSAGAPVLHFFTGSHGDYHKPTDTTDKVNAAGAAKVAEITANVALALAKREQPKLSFKNVATPPPRGDLRSYNASLGTVPDYAGPPNGQKGMLLGGVSPGGAAEKAGMKKGDILVKLGAHDITSVNDLMYVLNSSKPGETVHALVIRDSKKVDLEVTFQESRRHR